MKNLILFPKKKEDQAYLDNAATSLKFKDTIKSICSFYKKYPFNSHSFSSNISHSKMKNLLHETKKRISELLNCETGNISFIPSSSYGINFLALSFSSKINIFGKIVLTKLEHSSNIYPWLKASLKNKKIKVEYLKFKKDFSFDYEYLEKIREDIKIFSFCHVSNNLGIKNDIEKIVKFVKEKNKECIIIVDGSQSISSEEINIKKWGIDVFLFSCHKFYSSNGLGVMWMSNKAKKFFPEIMWGGGKNFLEDNLSSNKFEVGSISLAEIIGLNKTISIFRKLDLEQLRKKRKSLIEYTLKELSNFKNLEIYNKNFSESVITFNVKNFHSHDVVNFFSKRGVFLRSGNFCTPFIEDLIGRKSALRISLALYNEKEDIDLFLKNLKDINYDSIL